MSENIQITKKDSVLHEFSSIVHEANKADLQGDIFSESELFNAVMSFANSNNIGLEHSCLMNSVIVLQSFMTGNKPVHIESGITIPPYAWYLHCRVDTSTDEGQELWEMVENGSLTGLSMCGTATRKEVM